MSNELYESMAKHPDTGPIVALLDLVEPCDEFSRALVLVRDCFSANTTLRSLSRVQLRLMLRHRTQLLETFQEAVAEAARATGCEPQTFEQAWASVPDEQRESLHASYRAQVDKLMGR